MTCRSPYIDPTTGDYQLVNGERREDLSPTSEVVLALRTKRGSSAIAPWFGSRLHQIRKINGATKRLAEAYAREALQHLVDRGVLPGLTITAVVGKTSVALTITYRNARGVPVSIPYTHAVTG